VFEQSKEFPMTPRILVVDDDDAVRTMVEAGLERDGFEVVTASNVSDALRHIATEHFDVLLSDLHMPLAGDGFTVVSAMRHTHPKALTLVLSGYPALDEAMAAIISQADEIIVKPSKSAQSSNSFARDSPTLSLLNVRRRNR
jgi:DNA-binding NtrC family response regulator